VIPFRSSRTVPARRGRFPETVGAMGTGGAGRREAVRLRPRPGGVRDRPVPEALRAAAGHEGKIVFYEGEGRSPEAGPLRDGAVRTVALVVARGGFSRTKSGRAGAGCRCAAWEPILRVETAALAVLAMVMYHFEKEST